MKEGIHPDYVESSVTCGCGATFTTRSTRPKIHVEICSQCHPFFTGRDKFVDTAGRVERFQKKWGAESTQAVAAAKAKEVAAAVKEGAKGRAQAIGQGIFTNKGRDVQKMQTPQKGPGGRGGFGGPGGGGGGRRGPGGPGRSGGPGGPAAKGAAPAPKGTEGSPAGPAPKGAAGSPAGPAPKGATGSPAGIPPKGAAGSPSGAPKPAAAQAKPAPAAPKEQA